MEKTDESIWRICIAAVKRHTFKPLNYPLTMLFEKPSEVILKKEILNSFEKENNELVIVLTYLDDANWTLVTTKKVVSKIKNCITEAIAKDITSHRWFDFKGFRDKPTTYGKIEFNNSSMDIIIETGKASMIMIYAIKTLVAIARKSNDELDTQIRRWTKRGFLEDEMKESTN